MKVNFRGLLSPWTQRVKVEDITLHNIKGLSIRHRSFVFLQKDRPYCLDVELKHNYFSHVQPINPFTYIPIYKDSYICSFRYKSLKDCKMDLETIKRLKKLYNNCSV